MKNRNIKTSVLCVFLTLFNLQIGRAQEGDSTKLRPGQVSFFYPLGTNGIRYQEYSNVVSFNMLYGINGGLNGIEIGGLVNSELGDVNGIQIAGIANINTKQVNGVLFGGITNIVKDSSNMLCFAGISNVTGKSSTGFHFAGITNTVNGDFIGGQFGGVSNLVNGGVLGGQFAGIANVSNGITNGVQVAGISNIANGDLVGGQLGLVNRAKDVTGVQFGLINVAKSYKNGVPFGLISFVKDGYHALELAGGESIYGNASLKMGVEHLYTIYKVGYVTNKENHYWIYGLGFGSMFSITDKVKVSLDLSANHIVKPSFSPRLNILSKADFGFNYRLNKHFEVFAGPSLNVYVSESTLESENNPLKVPYTFFKENWWNNSGSTSLWIGANAGVRLLF